jgi:hypothetical protein
MKKDTPKLKPKMLPEVKITSTRIQPKKTERKLTIEMVRLYPKGMASKKSVDSLKKVGYGKAIGSPMMKKGQSPMYGTNASDIIKQALKKK